MKLLMLFPYAPLPPPLDISGTKRNLPFLLELVKYHRVSVLSYGTPGQEELFRKAYGALCQEVRFVNRARPLLLNVFELLSLLATGRSSFSRIYRPAMQQAIWEMTAAGRYDLLHCCEHAFGFFKFPAGIPVTAHTHDVMYELARQSARTTRNFFWSTLAYLDYRFGKREERACCAKFDLLIAPTEKDRRLLSEGFPEEKIVVIENGVGASFFEDVGLAPEPFSMVFTGLFTHLPNRQGMLYFLDRIFPLILAEVPQARVYVVGKDPPRALRSRASENVVVTGFVPDVRPFVARSQVFIIPLLAGSGIRGKALEAMAMRRPIVTTTVGVEGIHLLHEESALFADTPQDFARAVIRLFRDTTLRKRISEAAFATVLKEYAWEDKGKSLARVLRHVVGEPQATRVPVSCASTS